MIKYYPVNNKKNKQKNWAQAIPWDKIVFPPTIQHRFNIYFIDNPFALGHGILCVRIIFGVRNKIRNFNVITVTNEVFQSLEKKKMNKIKQNTKTTNK